MSKIFFIFSLILITSAASWSQIDINQFIQEFVNYNNWKQLILISCQFEGIELVTIARKLGERISISLILGTEQTAEHFLKIHIKPNMPILVMPSCSTSGYFLLKIGNKNGFIRKYKWWIIQHLNANHSNNFLKYLRLDSDLKIIGLDSSNSTSAYVWDIYRSDPNHPLNYQLQFEWSKINGINKSNLSHSHFSGIKDIFKSRAETLRGQTLRIAVLNNLDYEYDCSIDTNINGQIQLSGGFSQAILKELQSIFGFKVQMLETSTWGTAVDFHNTWSGLIGAVASHRADIALCHPTITSERAKVVSFLHPTLKGRRILFYRGAGLPVSRDVFVMTFSGSLWLCTISCLIILAIALWITAKLDPDPEQRPWSKWEAILWAVSAICQQGFSKSPNSLACMCVFATGYLTTYLLYTCFACGVTSLLAAQSQPVFIQPRDAAHLHLRFAAYWPGLNSRYFETSPDNLEKRLWTSELRKEKNRARTIQHLLSIVQGDKSVAMASDHVIHHYLANKIQVADACHLTLAQIQGSYNLKAFAMQLDSPKKYIFNYWLLRFQEIGILTLQQTRSLIRAPFCGNGPGYSSASIGHVMSAMVILAIGLNIAILCLWAERAWFRHKNEQYWEFRSKREIMKRLRKKKDKN